MLFSISRSLSSPEKPNHLHAEITLVFRFFKPNQCSYCLRVNEPHQTNFMISLFNIVLIDADCVNPESAMTLARSIFSQGPFPSQMLKCDIEIVGNLKRPITECNRKLFIRRSPCVRKRFVGWRFVKCCRYQITLDIILLIRYSKVQKSYLCFRSIQGMITELCFVSLPFPRPLPHRCGRLNRRPCGGHSALHYLQRVSFRNAQMESRLIDQRGRQYVGFQYVH
jgi:hypothetical protein